MNKKAVALLIYKHTLFVYGLGKNIINEYYANIPYVKKN